MDQIATVSFLVCGNAACYKAILSQDLDTNFTTNFGVFEN